MSSNMIRAMGTVAGWTMGSRILGFIRDMLMSRIIGAGMVADAFNTAFALPNLFRRFLAEGAMNTAFLPIYKETLDEVEESERFARNVLSTFLLILICLVALVQIFMPATILLLASGFVGDGRFEMAQDFSRITIFYIAFMSLSAFCGSILNAHQKFAAAAAAPIVLNVLLIPTLLYIWFFDIHGEQIGFILSWAIFAAGIVQLGVVHYAVRKMGISLKPVWPQWDKGLKRFFIVFLPALAASGIGQINLLIGRQIASWTEGAVSWLYYADRLIQLPMGVIGIPIGIVLLSMISGRDEERNDAQSRRYYNQAFLMSVFFSIPAAVALFAIPLPIVTVLFEGGKFGHVDSVATAHAVMIYALGTPALILYRADIQLFYARKNTRTPLIYAMIGLVVNLILAIALFASLGYLSAVIAATVSAWILALLAHFGSRRFGDAVRLEQKTKRQILLLILLAIVMGGLCFALAHWLVDWFTLAWLKWIALGSIVLISVTFYFSAGLWALGMKPRDIMRILSR